MSSRTYCKRLHCGQDLMLEIKRLAKDKRIKAGVILSAVGCVSKVKVRDAGGVSLRELEENCEIVSLMGTVSEIRTHLHISLAREDLSVIGGHLVEGCIINTTCELVIGELEGWEYGIEQDCETGYDEITFHLNQEQP